MRTPSFINIVLTGLVAASAVSGFDLAGPSGLARRHAGALLALAAPAVAFPVVDTDVEERGLQTRDPKKKKKAAAAKANKANKAKRDLAGEAEAEKDEAAELETRDPKKKKNAKAAKAKAAKAKAAKAKAAKAKKAKRDLEAADGEDEAASVGIRDLENNKAKRDDDGDCCF